MLTTALNGAALIALVAGDGAATTPGAVLHPVAVTSLMTITQRVAVRIPSTRSAPATSERLTPIASVTHSAFALDRSVDREARWPGLTRLADAEPLQTASLRALRLDGPRRRASPLDTRLTLRLTGDAHSMATDVGVAGGLVGMVRHALGN